MRLPRLRIHLLTAIILQIELGVLIWANMRTTQLEEIIGTRGTERGWPTVAYTKYPGMIQHAFRGEFLIEPTQTWSLSGIAIDCAVAIVVLTVT